MAEFGCIRPFHIDDGQLDGLTPKLPDAISRPVHAENRERIEEECRKSGRQFHLTWLAGDVSETWMQLEVAPR